MKLLRRLLTLLLCLLTPLTALSEGWNFRLTASIDPASFPEDMYTLASGMSQLLEAATLEGTLVTGDNAFRLDAALLLDSGSASSRTTLQLFGVPSHWGLRSSLLGDTQLRISCASLLPFGEKARNYLGLPLDLAALLVPYTHVDALDVLAGVTAPLFPAENGRTTLTRAQLDSIVLEVMRLCDEDPALNRYLHATGMYYTVMRCCEVYFSIPDFLLPSLTVRRSDDSLTWSSGLITFLSIREESDAFTLDFSVPTMAGAKLHMQREGDLLTGACSVDLGSLQLNGDFTLPACVGIPETLPISLTLDASAPSLPEGGVHLRLRGESQGNAIELRLLDPESSAVLLRVSGHVTAFEPEQLPAYTADAIDGVDVLSVNSDSLRRLMGEIRWPLLSGVFGLVVAAPAPAVQTLMDYAEDSGLIDLLTDMLSGGSGY